MDETSLLFKIAPLTYFPRLFLLLDQSLQPEQWLSLLEVLPPAIYRQSDHQVVGRLFLALTRHQIKIAALRLALCILQQTFRDVWPTIFKNYGHRSKNILRIRLVFCPADQTHLIKFEFIFLGKLHLNSHH